MPFVLADFLQGDAADVGAFEQDVDASVVTLQQDAGHLPPDGARGAEDGDPQARRVTASGQGVLSRREMAGLRLAPGRGRAPRPARPPENTGSAP